MSKNWLLPDWGYRRKITIHRSGNVITVNVGSEEKAPDFTPVEKDFTWMDSQAITVEKDFSWTDNLNVVEADFSFIDQVQLTVEQDFSWIDGQWDSETLAILRAFQS